MTSGSAGHEIQPRMYTPPTPQVSGGFAVAPWPTERRCRSALLGHGWERPPCFDAQCGHRGGLGCARPCPLPRGSLPVHQSLQEGQTASRSGAAPVLVGHAEQPHRPSGRSTGPPQPRSGAHIAFPQGIIGSGATPGRQGRGCENTLGAMPHQALGAGGRSRHGPSRSCATAYRAAGPQDAVAPADGREPRAHGRSVEVRIGPPRRLRIPVRSQVARRPSVSVSVLRRGARPAARRPRRIDRLPPVHGAAKDAAKAADGWRPPCESPEGRSVNRPLASFSHSSTAVSGSAGASANALPARQAAEQRIRLRERLPSISTPSAPAGFRRDGEFKPPMWPASVARTPSSTTVRPAP